MKVLFASDIHGRRLRMEAFLTLLDRERPDRIVLCGDYLYNGPRNGVPDDYDPLQVASLLNVNAKKTVGVRGNCDSRIDGDLLAFPLKDHRVFRLNGFRVDLFHGDAFSLKGLKPHPGDLLVSGHTHVWVLKREGGYVTLNPGSISFPKGGNGPTYALLEGKRLSVRSFPDGAGLAVLELK